MPRTFELVRHRDLSGVSGTGVVAEGCVFTDGSVALRWRGNNPATAVWPDLESVLAVHGHHGATEVHWLEGWTEPSPPPDPPALRGRPPLGERGARPLQDFYSPSSPSTPTSGPHRTGADSTQSPLATGNLHTRTPTPDPGTALQNSQSALDSTTFANSNAFAEHLEPAPSETSPTFLDAAQSSLDGPTILPRLAGLEYATPLDDSPAAGLLHDSTASTGLPNGTAPDDADRPGTDTAHSPAPGKAGWAKSNTVTSPLGGLTSPSLARLDYPAALGDSTSSGQPVTSSGQRVDRTAPGDAARTEPDTARSPLGQPTSPKPAGLDYPTPLGDTPASGALDDDTGANRLHDRTTPGDAARTEPDTARSPLGQPTSPTPAGLDYRAALGDSTSSGQRVTSSGQPVDETAPGDAAPTEPNTARSPLGQPTSPRPAGLDYVAPNGDGAGSGDATASGDRAALGGASALGDTPVLGDTPILADTSALGDTPVVADTSALGDTPILGDTSALGSRPVLGDGAAFADGALDDRALGGAALGDGVLGDGSAFGAGVLGDRAAFGERAESGGFDGAAGADEDDRAAPDDNRAAVDDDRAALDDDRAALDELFGVRHAVLPPSGPVEPMPGGRVRGWAGARHLR